VITTQEHNCCSIRGCSKWWWWWFCEKFVLHAEYSLEK